MQMKWIVLAAIVYVLFSVALTLLTRKLKSPSLKAAILTFFFTATLAAAAAYAGMYYSFWAGVNSEYLRRASIGTARDVATLKLIQKSNAKQVAPNQAEWVSKALETEIDWLLPVADDYVRNRSSWQWRLQDFWYLGDMEPSLARDLPPVVEYRIAHPKVFDRGSYDEIMKRYDKARQP